VTCLPASEHDSVFTIDEASLCVVAKYDAAIEIGTDSNFYTAAPTWGRHGGPLLVKPTVGGAAAEIDLTRMTPPGMPTGALTLQSDTIDLNISGTFFLGSQAIDVGSTWTFVSWSGSGFIGEAVPIDGTTVGTGFSVAGLFAGVGLGGPNSDRLLHTSLTALQDGQGTQTAGLYAADVCAGPMICTAPAPAAVETWHRANGPVAADGDGNVFALQTNPAFLGGDDTQSLHAYAARDVEPGDSAVNGVELFSTAGYGLTMGVMTATGSSDGYILFQPYSSNSFLPEEPLVQRYKVAGPNITAEGTPTTALTRVDNTMELMLLNDDAGRAWVGVRGVGSSTFYVLDRNPAP
jgi:hypothetical protein